MPRFARLAAGILLVLAIVALLGVTGCGSTPKQSDSQSTDNPLAAKPETSTTPPAKLVTAEEIAKITGIKGVQSVAQGSNERATGTLNFANDKGGIFMIVMLGTTDQYDSSLSSTTFGEKTTGVGDEAYIGPAKSVSKTPNQVVFKKGKDSVAITSFFESPTKTVLTIDQMKEIGNIIASRL